MSSLEVYWRLMNQKSETVEYGLEWSQLPQNEWPSHKTPSDLIPVINEEMTVFSLR